MRGAALRADAEVVLQERESGPNRRLRLRVEGWPGGAPGQFVMLSPGPVQDVRQDDPLLPRPMAIFRELPGSPPEVEILFKVEGRGTALLAGALPGQRVRVLGPLGRPFDLPQPSDHVVVVGGGTGVASLFGLVRASRARQSVVLGARSADDLMARADFEACPVDVVFTTEDGSLGERGLVTAPLERLLAAGDVARVVCCGPTPMMRACAERAARHGVPCTVSLENHMACGFGVCLGCAAPTPSGRYALVCRDGPVFDAAEIAWEGLP